MVPAEQVAMVVGADAVRQLAGGHCLTANLGRDLDRLAQHLAQLRLELGFFGRAGCKAVDRLVVPLIGSL